MKLLLKFGADPNQRGINNYKTPLEMAVDAGLSEIAEALGAGGEKRRF